jgi:hypothetical protein
MERRVVPSKEIEKKLWAYGVLLLPFLRKAALKTEGLETRRVNGGVGKVLRRIYRDTRDPGITRWVDLPEIIICGDQSFRKSSVLEAISGMLFPIEDNLCTRFATELVLKRGD